MIRINLLPHKRSTKRTGESAGGGQMWLGVVGGFILLELIALLFVYKSKQDEFDAARHKNGELKESIDALKKQVADHPEIKARLKELKDREEAINTLQAGRTGPTAMVLELSKILTPGRGPTADRDRLEQLKRDNPTAVPNPTWDPKRVWIKSFSEADRNMKISGFARDGEDVSEVLRRMNVSDYFTDVKMLPANKAIDSATKLDGVNFDISAKARY